MDRNEGAVTEPNPNLGTNPSELDAYDNLEPTFGVSVTESHRRSMYGVELAYNGDPLFKPTVVTIGPIHHQKRGLLAKEHKERFLNSILKTGLVRREDLTNDMRGLEAETRKSYPENFPNISSDDFVMMMVLDGCFIVHLMRLHYKNRSQNEQINDPIFTNPRMLAAIRRDLLLMENQLPLCILDQLFQRTRTKRDLQPFHILALEFFEPLKLEKAVNSAPSDSSRDCKHLLALFQLACLRNYSRSNAWTPKEDDDQLCIPDIQTIRSSGMRIEKNPVAEHLLDIKLRRRTLRIPTLLINNNSTFVLRNLLAYELADVDAPTYIASLALFYGSMVKDLEDLKVLKKAEVINKAPTVTDEQVLHLMKALLKDLSILQVDDFCLEEQIKNISNYFKSIWYKLHLFNHHCLQCWPGLCKRLFWCSSVVITES